jgi:hypothetical protein
MSDRIRDQLPARRTLQLGEKSDVGKVAEIAADLKKNKNQKKTGKNRGQSSPLLRSYELGDGRQHLFEMLKTETLILLRQGDDATRKLKFQASKLLSPH